MVITSKGYLSVWYVHIFPYYYCKFKIKFVRFVKIYANIIINNKLVETKHEKAKEFFLEYLWNPTLLKINIKIFLASFIGVFIFTF